MCLDIVTHFPRLHLIKWPNSKNPIKSLLKSRTEESWAWTTSCFFSVHPKVDFPWRTADRLQPRFHECAKDQRHPHSNEEWHAGCWSHFPQTHSRDSGLGDSRYGVWDLAMIMVAVCMTFTQSWDVEDSSSLNQILKPHKEDNIALKRGPTNLGYTRLNGR